MGNPLRFAKKGAESPSKFSAHVYCGQTAGSIKMALGMEVGLSPCDIVLDGDPAPSPKRGGEFSAHFYCDQTAGCIKMPLGMEVDLSPGNFVLDGDPAPSPKRGLSSQILGLCLLWPDSWMDQDGTWREGMPQPRRLCVRWGHSPLPKKGADPLPNFWPISIVAKRLDASRCDWVWS